MTKETAKYIWHCITIDSIYNWGVSDWCDDRSIDESDLDEFICLVKEAINELEAN